jgi:hypothetical protein
MYCLLSLTFIFYQKWFDETNGTVLLEYFPFPKYSIGSENTLSSSELDERNSENKLREIESSKYLEKNHLNNRLNNNLLVHNESFDEKLSMLHNRQTALMLSRLEKRKRSLVDLLITFNSTSIPLKRLLLLKRLSWFIEECELKPSIPNTTEYLQMIEDDINMKRIRSEIEKSKEREVQDFFRENFRSG